MEHAGQRRRHARLPVRHTERHGHLQRAAIVHEPFQKQSMVPHHVAVVTGEHDNGSIFGAAVPQRLQYPTHAIVNHLDHAVGDRDGLRSSCSLPYPHGATQLR